jgi:hypothetical protein
MYGVNSGRLVNYKYSKVYSKKRRFFSPRRLGKRNTEIKTRLINSFQHTLFHFQIAPLFHEGLAEGGVFYLPETEDAVPAAVEAVV